MAFGVLGALDGNDDRVDDRECDPPAGAPAQDRISRRFLSNGNFAMPTGLADNINIVGRSGSVARDTISVGESLNRTA